jgi:hypothetical protein
MLYVNDGISEVGDDGEYHPGTSTVVEMILMMEGGGVIKI